MNTHENWKILFTCSKHCIERDRHHYVTIVARNKTNWHENSDLPAKVSMTWHCRQATRTSNDVVFIFHRASFPRFPLSWQNEPPNRPRTIVRGNARVNVARSWLSKRERGWRGRGMALCVFSPCTDSYHVNIRRRNIRGARVARFFANVELSNTIDTIDSAIVP